MKVWIINQYATTPETGAGGRHYLLAKELVARGHDIHVISASYSHLMRNPPDMKGDFLRQKVDGVNYLWLKVKRFSNAHSKQRVLNWFKFAWKIRNVPRILHDRPDAILYSSLSLIGYLSALKLAKKFQVPLIFEVRDIWPLTLTEIGGVSKKHPLVMLMQWIEDKAYRESTRVISNLKNSVDHMVTRGLDPKKFAWIPNGFSMSEMQLEPLSAFIVEQIPKNKFIVGYAGTIGLANALDQMILAADALKEHVDIAFVLVGSGKEKKHLQTLVEEHRLTNVVFIDAIPKKQVQTILHKYFDVCFISWHDEAIYRFGIGANKLPEYLYSSRPVLHAYSGAGDPVLEAKAGITVPAGDVKGISSAVMTLYNMSDAERNEMGLNGKKYALHNYDYNKLAVQLENLLLSH